MLLEALRSVSIVRTISFEMAAMPFDAPAYVHTIFEMVGFLVIFFINKQSDSVSDGMGCELTS